jgi:hypothetical protein
VLDLDVALFDVDVGRAVLAHRPELHEVAVGHVLAQREEQVQRADDVVALGLDRVAAGDHRVRRGGLLGVVHDALGQELTDHAVEEVAVLEVADVRRQLASGDLAPRLDAVRQRADRRQRVGRPLKVPAPAGEVVDDRDFVPARGKMQRGGPPEVAVTAQNQETAHARSALPKVFIGCTLCRLPV